jgi:hypothetical protein
MNEGMRINPQKNGRNVLLAGLSFITGEAETKIGRNEPQADLRQKQKVPADLAIKRGQIGGWEFATLSFPCWH